MKYVQVEQFGGSEVLHLVEAANPTPQAGEIAIDVKAAGVNFADVMARAGTYPGVSSVPFRPGYEIAGVVAALSSGVTDFHVGDRVMGFLTAMGGYATHAILKAQDAIRLPKELDFAPATALLVQGLTAYFLLEAGAIQPGSSVLIPGAAGGVGSLAIQIARLKGAGKIIGLASPAKHDLVRSLGADAAIDYTQSGWSRKVVAETGGQGVDIYLDSQGDLAGEGFDALAQKARWLIFGGQAESSGSLGRGRMGIMVGKNITLRGYTVFSDAANFGRALTEMVGWVTAGRLKLSVQRFALADVARAHEAIENRKTTGKVVLEP